jgi:hydrogenase expression/formation protein HypD
MEVCGTHTVSIFRNGIRSVLPDTVSLLSGPGCPVCVTDQTDIDAFIALARQQDVIITTFGDLMRVPGFESSLQLERAGGCDIRMIYSPMDALDIAQKHPDKRIVFLGVGFETTTPAIAASILAARTRQVDNFFVFSAHKLVPPALDALMQLNERNNIDGFLLPGHVSVIIGVKGYREFFGKHSIPCAIAGFEPEDILQAMLALIVQVETGCPKLENAYPRAVTDEGNPKAEQILQEVFEPADVYWRGIGVIPGSGLKIRPEFSSYDAEKSFDLGVSPVRKEDDGCACGDILTGLKTPLECPLYKKKCTPLLPYGPCMVSSEGTCAAYYRYHTRL